MSGLDAVLDGALDQAQQVAVRGGRAVQLEVERGAQLLGALPVEHGTVAVRAAEHRVLQHQAHRVPDKRLVVGRVRRAPVVANGGRAVAAGRGRRRLVPLLVAAVLVLDRGHL